MNSLAPSIRLNDRDSPLTYFLAPMAGITDSVFRLLMREMGAHAVISELISADGLVRGGERTREMLHYFEQERPIGIQLFGAEISTLTEASKMVESKGVDFIDLNFGCPVNKVVSKGAGAAWLKDLNSLSKLLLSIKNSVSIPLTIKIRTGWDCESINASEIVRVAYECGVKWVSIHGRTRSQGYSGLSNWELIKTIAKNSPIPIIGNGDILSALEAKSKIRFGYSHGVMIGRGALKNPWIFREIERNHTESRDLLSLIERHFEIALQKKGSIRAHLSLKKFMAWYASGLPNASLFRSQIFATKDIDELKRVTKNYFSTVDVREKKDDKTPFLMGGHG